MAEWMQQLHPLRLQFELFSNANPMMAPVDAWADGVRKNRTPAAAGNPFLALQENVSRQIVAALDAWRDTTEALAERTFLTVYGQPTLQAAVGVDPAGTRPLRKAPRNPIHHELLQKRIAELKSRMPIGGVREAVIRGLIYAGLGRGSVDERGFETVRRLRRAHGDIPLPVFKALVREQFYMLLVDEKAALAAIPGMLPGDAETRREMFGLVSLVLGARGDFSAEDQRRMAEVARLFGVETGSAAGGNVTLLPKAS
jgi:hypothetical protein